MSPKYVELDRTFLDFHDQDEEIDLVHRQVIADFTGKITNWDNLIKCSCAVILGEAGSGKTCEFQERSRILSKSGQYSFFCRIEDLSKEGLEPALELSNSYISSNETK